MPNKFNLDLFTLPFYERNNSKALFDPVRKIFIQATPEEEVRIKFIHYLVNELHIPLETLKTEYNLKRNRGRIDIACFYPDEGKPLFIVECKAPEKWLTDDVLDRAKEYDEILKSGLIVLTNGRETEFKIFDTNKRDYFPLDSIPTYADILNRHSLTYKEPEDLKAWHRPSYQDLKDYKTVKEALENEWLGPDSPQEHHKYIVNLIGLIQDFNSSLGLPIEYQNFKILNEGYRYTGFGNASGGSWEGDYRYFIIKTSKGDNQVISFSILGNFYSAESEMYQKFSNLNGHSYLIVAVDDFDKKHNSLQLDLDKFVEIKNESIIIWHNGSLTKGKKGQAQRSTVIDYVLKHAPHLFKNNRIELGQLPYNRLIKWEDAKDFIIKCMDYALLRDQIRKLGT